MFRIVPGLSGMAVLSALGLLVTACSSPPAERAPAPAREPVAPAAATPAAGGEAVVSGKAPAAVGGLSAIVILQPQAATALADQTAVPVMDQVSMSFTPAVLFARTGQPTEFRNSDEELHNIRVRNDETKEAAFNVALPTGGTFRHTFPSDGFYDVGCDIHPGMAAVVVATTTPYVALADRDGAFSIAGVPPGAYTLTVYADVRKIERQAVIAPGRTDLGVLDQ